MTARSTSAAGNALALEKDPSSRAIARVEGSLEVTVNHRKSIKGPSKPPQKTYKETEMAADMCDVATVTHNYQSGRQSKYRDEMTVKFLHRYAKTKHYAGKMKDETA